MPKTEHVIRQALLEVGSLMERAFADAGETPVPDSALHQRGLKDGVDIVEEYLTHGELGLALEHVIYMVHEPNLPISRSTLQLIDEAARDLQMETEVEKIKP